MQGWRTSPGLVHGFQRDFGEDGGCSGGEAQILAPSAPQWNPQEPLRRGGREGSGNRRVVIPSFSPGDQSLTLIKGNLRKALSVPSRSGPHPAQGQGDLCFRWGNVSHPRLELQKLGENAYKVSILCIFSTFQFRFHAIQGTCMCLFEGILVERDNSSKTRK